MTGQGRTDDNEYDSAQNNIIHAQAIARDIVEGNREVTEHNASTALESVVHWLPAEMERIERVCTEYLRRLGCTWDDIAKKTGRPNRQAAFNRYRRIGGTDVRTNDDNTPVHIVKRAHGHRGELSEYFAVYESSLDAQRRAREINEELGMHDESDRTRATVHTGPKRQLAELGIDLTPIPPQS